MDRPALNRWHAPTLANHGPEGNLRQIPAKIEGLRAKAIFVAQQTSNEITLARRWVDLAASGMNEQSTSSSSKLELLTEAELAKLLKVCRRQLYSWRLSGAIPYFKVGRAVRFRVTEVAEALEKFRPG
jgi:excisionase family DNA binding protein